MQPKLVIRASGCSTLSKNNQKTLDCSSKNIVKLQTAATPPHLLGGVQYEVRTFRLEMEVCSYCGGKMRMVAAITDPVSIKAYLDGVGLPSSAPAIAPARPPPQEEFDYSYDDA